MSQLKIILVTGLFLSLLYKGYRWLNNDNINNKIDKLIINDVNIKRYVIYTKLINNINTKNELITNGCQILYTLPSYDDNIVTFIGEMDDSQYTIIKQLPFVFKINLDTPATKE